MLAYTPEQAKLVEISKQTMEKHLNKPYLMEGFIPDFAVGCRRTTPVSTDSPDCTDEGVFLCKSLTNLPPREFHL